MADQSQFGADIDKVFEGNGPVSVPVLASKLRQKYPTIPKGVSDKEVVGSWANQFRSQIPKQWGSRKFSMDAPPAEPPNRIDQAIKTTFDKVGDVVGAHAVKSLGGSTMTELYEKGGESVRGIMEKVLGEPSSVTASRLQPASTVVESVYEAGKTIPHIVDSLYTPGGAAAAAVLPGAPPAIRAGAEAAFSTNMLRSGGGRAVRGLLTGNVPEAVGGAAEAAASFLPVVHARAGAKTAERNAGIPDKSKVEPPTARGITLAPESPEGKARVAAEEQAKRPKAAIDREVEQKFHDTKAAHDTAIQRHSTLQGNLSAAKTRQAALEQKVFEIENGPQALNPETTKILDKLNKDLSAQKEHVVKLTSNLEAAEATREETKTAHEETAKQVKDRNITIPRAPRKAVEVEGMGERDYGKAPIEAKKEVPGPRSEVLSGKGTAKDVAESKVSKATALPAAGVVTPEVDIHGNVVQETFSAPGFKGGSLPQKQFYTATEKFRVPIAGRKFKMGPEGRAVPEEGEIPDIKPGTRVFYRGRNASGQPEFMVNDRVMQLPATVPDATLRRMVEDPRKQVPSTATEPPEARPTPPPEPPPNPGLSSPPAGISPGAPPPPPGAPPPPPPPPGAPPEPPAAPPAAPPVEPEPQPQPAPPAAAPETPQAPPAAAAGPQLVPQTPSPAPTAPEPVAPPAPAPEAPKKVVSILEERKAKAGPFTVTAYPKGIADASASQIVRFDTMEEAQKAADALAKDHRVVFTDRENNSLPVGAALTPEQAGKKILPSVRQDAMKSQAKGVEQPQPPAVLPEPPEPRKAPVVEMKPKAAAPVKSKFPPSLTNAYDKMKATPETDPKYALVVKEFERRAKEAKTSAGKAMVDIEAERNPQPKPEAQAPAAAPEPPTPRAAAPEPVPDTASETAAELARLKKENAALKGDEDLKEAPIPIEKKHIDSTAYGLNNLKAQNVKKASFSVTDEQGKPIPLLDGKGKPLLDEKGKPILTVEINPNSIDPYQPNIVSTSLSQPGAHWYNFKDSGSAKKTFTGNITERDPQEIANAAKNAAAKEPPAPRKAKPTPEEKKQAELAKELEKLKKENASLKGAASQEPPTSREEMDSQIKKLNREWSSNHPSDPRGEVAVPLGEDYTKEDHLKLLQLKTKKAIADRKQREAESPAARPEPSAGSSPGFNKEDLLEWAKDYQEVAEKKAKGVQEEKAEPSGPFEPELNETYTVSENVPLANGNIQKGSKLLYKGTDKDTGASTFIIESPKGERIIHRISEDDIDLVLDAIRPKE